MSTSAETARRRPLPSSMTSAPLAGLSVYDDSEADSDDADEQTVGPTDGATMPLVQSQQNQGKTDDASEARTAKRRRTPAAPPQPRTHVSEHDGRGDGGDGDRGDGAGSGLEARVAGTTPSNSNRWVRSFAHVRGNWPSHVYIRVRPSGASPRRSSRARVFAPTYDRPRRDRRVHR